MPTPIRDNENAETREVRVLFNQDEQHYYALLPSETNSLSNSTIAYQEVIEETKISPISKKRKISELTNSIDHEDAFQYSADGISLFSIEELITIGNINSNEYNS